MIAPADFAFLAVKALLIASVPLAVIWAARAPEAHQRHDEKFRRLAWATVFFTFDLIVFGGFTRLTDSGLGCPDWPGCYAKANPFAAAGEIGAAQAAMPFGPVTMTKAWIEMVHRYLAMAVGVLILVMAALAWWRFLRRRVGSQSGPRAIRLLVRNGGGPWIPSLLLALVCLQGAFGAWTVTMKLQPLIVTMHLLLAMALLALLTWHASRLDRQPTDVHISSGLRALAFACAGTLALQIALGGWVSTNYAVLACTEIPLCQGQLLPPMDFANGFHLWRKLGKAADNSWLPFAALTAIHWTHRSFALVVFALLGALAWQARRYRPLRAYANVLALLLVAQFATGVVTVLFGWPLAAAVLHNAGAAALVILIVLLNYKIRVTPGRTRTLPANPTVHAASS